MCAQWWWCGRVPWWVQHGAERVRERSDRQTEKQLGDTMATDHVKGPPPVRTGLPAPGWR